MEGVDLGTHGTDHNLYARGDFLFQSNYNDGFRLQVFDPLSGGPLLEEKAFFDTQPGSDSPGFAGLGAITPSLTLAPSPSPINPKACSCFRTTFTRALARAAVGVSHRYHARFPLTIDSCIVAGPVALELARSSHLGFRGQLAGAGRIGP